jgi:hypothetical protein
MQRGIPVLRCTVRTSLRTRLSGCRIPAGVAVAEYQQTSWSQRVIAAEKESALLNRENAQVNRADIDGRAMGKAEPQVPFGREVVTLSCGNPVGGSAPQRALNGGSQI